MSEVNNVPMIYAALTHAAASINAVGKNQKNEAQGWNFRSIDAVYNALNPALIAAGLTVVPCIVDKEITTTEDTGYQGKVKRTTTARLTMQYTVYAQDGSKVTATVIGEGMDYGDKACNKAMAIAYKYFAFQLFCIPTEEMKRDDPDWYIMDGTEKPVESHADKKTVDSTLKRKASVIVTKTESMPISKTAVIKQLADDAKMSIQDVNQAWSKLRADGIVPDKKTADLTDEEFTAAVAKFRAAYIG